MFIWFSENKANYNRGQIFPLVIAIIVAVMIMAMITANLGKIAIFRTDVANAADAGALAGASTLSATLLGYGLTSDMWCGKGLIAAIRMTFILALGYDFSIRGIGEGGSVSYSSSGSGSTSYREFANDLIAVIQIYASHLIDYFTDYMTAYEDGQMAWANAKQKALSFAFSNVGVDQPPKIKFKDYGGSYDAWLVDESAQNGFYQFTRHQITGYSQHLLQDLEDNEIKPGSGLSPIETYSGYGWTENDDGSFSESYPGGVDAYKSYENYVEVTVNGSILYPVEMLSFVDYFGDTAVTIMTACVLVGTFVKYYEQFGDIPYIGWLIALLLAIAVTAIYRVMLEYLPVGFTFPDRDMADQTTNNPITVQVTRHKASHDTLLWNFQYGDVDAQAAGHAYPENDNITIEPTLLESFKNIDDMFDSFGADDILSQGTDLALDQLMNIRTLFCMGLSFDLAFNVLFNPFNVLWILFEYIIITQFCNSDEDFGLDPDNMGSTSTAEDSFSGSDDANDWFNTGYHLFETELVTGFMQ